MVLSICTSSIVIFLTIITGKYPIIIKKISWRLHLTGGVFLSILTTSFIFKQNNFGTHKNIDC